MQLIACRSRRGNNYVQIVSNNSNIAVDLWYFLTFRLQLNLFMILRFYDFENILLACLW